MIGVFDSGLGGLTVLKTITEKLPQYDYVYLGDNARAPYGNKSAEAIFTYTKEAIDFLFKQGCELIIIACNTASAKALRRIQQEYLPGKYPNKRVLGVLIPAAEAAQVAYQNAKNKTGKRIGIMATRATIESKVYEQELKKVDAEIKVESVAAPLLVSLVEEGWSNRPETKKILKKYLQPLKQKDIQILILGCTHYPFLEKQIKGIVGKKVMIINTPEAVAKQLINYLKRHPEIEKKLTTKGLRKFFTTDDTGNFKHQGERFLKEKIKDLKKIEL